mmetsp:Transcript_4880/g.11623  ORF Transcript_4880/g.11623 Transcript_4880/m.11623 type:complete len:116 (+) Transcript_4880:1092-1439(+)
MGPLFYPLLLLVVVVVVVVFVRLCPSCVPKAGTAFFAQFVAITPKSREWQGSAEVQRSRTGDLAYANKKQDEAGVDKHVPSEHPRHAPFFRIGRTPDKNMVSVPETATFGEYLVK